MEPLRNTSWLVGTFLEGGTRTVTTLFREWDAGQTRSCTREEGTVNHQWNYSKPIDPKSLQIPR